MTTTAPDTKENILNDPPIIKRKVGRPGRKKLDVESKNKRTQQNRIAQRAYRERKEQKLKNLENKIVWLEQLNLQNLNEINFINANLKRLLDDLKQYRSFNDDDLFLLKFLNEKNDIKSLINNEISKINNNLKESNINRSNHHDEDNDNDNKVIPNTDLKLNNNIQPLSSNNNSFDLINTWVNTTSITNSNSNNNSSNCDSSPDIIDNNISNNISNGNNNSNNNNNNIWDSFPILDNLTSISSDDVLDFNNAFEDNKGYKDILKVKNIDNNNIDIILNNIAFPDIWENSNKDMILKDNINNNNDLASNLNILPFDCNCGGVCFNNQISFDNKYNDDSNYNNVVCNSACNSACNSDDDNDDDYNDDTAVIKCDLLTRHLLNKESIQSIINDKNFMNNNTTNDTFNAKFPLSCSHFIRRIKVRDEISFEDEVEKLCNELMIKCRHDPVNESILLEKGELKKAIVS
ncbi:Cad1p PWA37_001758 [Arxiozyma heterogenica]|uniref:BZIP domain-containing protein n=1 Tax=Arxiozyma heterogenica TaxID=278026 RepID=A0AAN8A8D9_9SACH|nr:hypothetical protein RI543_002414 [Kazachstania heterogenica]